MLLVVRRPVAAAISLATCLAACLAAAPQAEFSHPSSKVTVTDAKPATGKGAVLTCQVTHCLLATVTITVHGTNVRAVDSLPGTFVTEAGTRQWRLAPADPTKPWKYDFKVNWRPGGMTGHHENKMLYELPYRSTDRRQVIQGNFGTHSHGPGTGDEYATDWAMPVGSTVCAARAGIVVAVKQDSEKHGVGPEFSKFANYVVIRHDDGTCAQYLHLSKHGALVPVGARVNAGDVIALSGHTGNSTAPHLHFAVFVNKDGRVKTSLPIRWKTRAGTVDALTRGQWY